MECALVVPLAGSIIVGALLPVLIIIITLAAFKWLDLERVKLALEWFKWFKLTIEASAAPREQDRGQRS